MHKKLMKIMGTILEAMEFLLAIIILLVLGVMIVIEVGSLVQNPGEFFSEGFLDTFLGSITTMIVAVEFVKMLLRPTVGNTLEMLIMAVARYVVLHHHDYVAIAVGVGGIVALFAARRFLIAKMPMEHDEEVEDEKLMNAEL